MSVASRQQQIFRGRARTPVPPLFWLSLRCAGPYVQSPLVSATFLFRRSRRDAGATLIFPTAQICSLGRGLLHVRHHGGQEALQHRRGSGAGGVCRPAVAVRLAYAEIECAVIIRSGGGFEV